MEKGDTFTYRKKEYLVLSKYKAICNGEEFFEYAAEMIEDNSLHRFYFDEHQKLKKII